MQDTIEGLYQALGAVGAFPEPPMQHACYIANLPPDTQDLHLLKLLSPYGAIPPRGIKTMLNDDGSCKGIAFVNFTREDGAQNACAALNGAVMPSGNTLIVRLKQGKGTKSGGGMDGGMAGMDGMGGMGCMGGMDGMGKGKGKSKSKGNFKTTLCTLFAAGNCHRPECSFAHGEEELQPFTTALGGGDFFAPRPNAKTKLCTLFAAGNCSRPSCSFAHGEAELQGFNVWT